MPATVDRTRPFAALRQLMGDRFTTAAALCEQHGRGEAHHPVQAPEAVAFVRSTEEVARIVELCAEHRVPVVAFGAGTSLEGHVAAVAGGVSIDLTQMSEVVAVHPEDLDATVQAGVVPQPVVERLVDLVEQQHVGLHAVGDREAQSRAHALRPGGHRTVERGAEAADLADARDRRGGLPCGSSRPAPPAAGRSPRRSGARAGLRRSPAASRRGRGSAARRGRPAARRRGLAAASSCPEPRVRPARSPRPRGSRATRSRGPRPSRRRRGPASRRRA